MDLRDFIQKNNLGNWLLNQLGKYENPQEVFDYLCEMPVCCESKKKELRVDERYLLWINKKSFLSSFSIYLFQTENIEFCYFSHSSEGSTGGKIGLKYSDGNEERLITLEGDFGGHNMKSVFECIRRFVQGFENLSPSYKEYRIKSPDKAVYTIGPEGLFREWTAPFSLKLKKRNLLPSLQDICWCEQYVSSGDSCDEYSLNLYLANGKKICLDAVSVWGAFLMALALKDNVPHLMYEPCEEYRKIYKQDPGKLMEIAKNRISEKM